jgi:para-nitrobenzyl esterase
LEEIVHSTHSSHGGVWLNAGVCALTLTVFVACVARADGKPVPVTVHNFIRAETDRYFSEQVRQSGLGHLVHTRQPAAVDQQHVVRMNRDTLYSSGVFDLDAAPIIITLPHARKRYMALLAINQDHYAMDIVYAPGRKTFTRQTLGTRYAFFIIRTLANANDPADVRAANALQDAVTVEQAKVGTFEVPNWDSISLAKARDALSALGALGGIVNRFGTRDQVDPLDHLIGTAIGWGGNPRSAADYQSFYPRQNDGKTPHCLTVKDVPVDGFWSITVYNAEGFMERNDLGQYSVNNLTAKPNADGSFTIQFGGNPTGASNYLPIMPGWNYTVRLYRPRNVILDGTWNFPETQPLQVAAESTSKIAEGSCGMSSKGS